MEAGNLALVRPPRDAGLGAIDRDDLQRLAGCQRPVRIDAVVIHDLLRAVQANAQHMQPTTALPDAVVETDEAFQNAGKKGERHADPEDPLRRRANKRRGHGTYDNDRPPIMGSVGRDTRQVRLRVIKRTDRHTLEQHVHQFTSVQVRVNIDEWRGYTHIEREHVTVHHGVGEWARDADGDGVREVHTNTAEGMWTGLRNFLRPFRGVHKKHLAGYVAMHEHAITLKAISPDFIARLVKSI